MTTTIRSFISSAAAALAVSAASPADTIHVNGSCGDDAWTGASAACAAPDGPKATIQAGVDAAVPGDVVLVAPGTYSGPGNREISLRGKAITLRSAGGAAACTIDSQRAGRAFRLTGGETLATVIEGFTIANGLAGPPVATGGAMFFDFESGATVRDCVFTGNEGEIGGAVYHRNGGNLAFDGCTFQGNYASVDVGAVFALPETLALRNCDFADNVGLFAIGGLEAGNSEVTMVNCSFRRNIGDFLLGGAGLVDCEALIANCEFSRNVGNMGGGLLFGGWATATIVNSSFSLNDQFAVGMDGSASTYAFINSIAWNSGGLEHPGLISHSNVEQFDPLFVQPGSDDLRLGIGSPCLDAGSTALLPPDALDLDGDGDTSELVPLDLAGSDRVQGAAVDMGAYEGAFESKPAYAGDGGVGPGQTVVLIPDGVPFNPLEHMAVIFRNTSASVPAAVSVSHFDVNLHPGAEGFSNPGQTIVLQTTAMAGECLAKVLVPFATADLGGADPMHVDVTCFDPRTGSWALAVSGNVTPSPGYAGPIGDRVAVAGPDNWGIGNDLGDYGVYWDASSGRGTAWAIVDHGADFAIGVATCPADCRQGPDGVVGIVDLLALLERWGLAASGGPCDVDYDGAVSAADMVALLDAWGQCSPPMPASAGDRAPQLASADLDFSGRTDSGDLHALLACWGGCAAGNHADLDGDGTVGARDLNALLASWGGATE